MDIEISRASTPADLREVARLFVDYAASLPVDLAYQGFAAELEGLPGPYAPPSGALLLARSPAGDAVGCVGVRPLALAGCCELKRLYAAPAARGAGVGRALTAAAMAFARTHGYREMRLDTLPSMDVAVALYARLGFRPCAPYYGPTPPGTVFMTREL